MTKKEYISNCAEITEIIAPSEDHDCAVDDDVEDGGVGSMCLAKFLGENENMLEALEYFSLRPGSLAKIVTEIGGAEIYRFEQMELLEDIRQLYHAVVLLGLGLLEACDAMMSAESFRAVVHGRLREELEYLGLSADDLERDRPYLKENGTSADKVLGAMIHLRHATLLKHYIGRGPSGDDTYFDYYPGEMYYHMAIMEWFLGDGPRMA